MSLGIGRTCILIELMVSICVRKWRDGEWEGWRVGLRKG